MSIQELIRKNRSYRKFNENEPVSKETLRALVNLARLSPSAANRQPLKYVLSCNTKENERIFRHLSWAAYLTDWNGPEKGERPAAYIIINGDRNITPDFYCDHGIAAQSILLGAAEKGLGGCIIASIDRENLRKDLSIPSNFDVLLVIALGKPAEKVLLEPLPENGDIKYWRSRDKVHHVPKRSLDEIIVSDD